MATSPIIPTTGIVVQAEAPTNAQFSRSTVAHINATQEQLVATKKSMIEDMASRQLPVNETTFAEFQALQAIETSIQKLKERVATQTPDTFSPRDVETMRKMKQAGVTESVIASRFVSNQTKVNRLLNGAPPTSDS